MRPKSRPAASGAGALGRFGLSAGVLRLGSILSLIGAWMLGSHVLSTVVLPTPVETVEFLGMQERTVTVGGVARPLPDPFFVMATQNPFEMEGTYSLPEAQVDRFFFKVRIPYPSEEVLESIVDQTTGPSAADARQVLAPDDVLRLRELVRTVPIAPHVRTAAVRLVLATQPGAGRAPEEVRSFIRFGASPRGAQVLVLAAKAHALLRGRYHASLADLSAVVLPALRHRVHLNARAGVEGVTEEQVIARIADVELERARA